MLHDAYKENQNMLQNETPCWLKSLQKILLELGMGGLLSQPNPNTTQSVHSNLGSSAASLQTGVCPQHQCTHSWPITSRDCLSLKCGAKFHMAMSLSLGSGQLCVPTWCCLQCPGQTLTLPGAHWLRYGGGRVMNMLELRLAWTDCTLLYKNSSRKTQYNIWQTA